MAPVTSQSERPVCSRQLPSPLQEAGQKRWEKKEVWGGQKEVYCEMFHLQEKTQCKAQFSWVTFTNLHSKGKTLNNKHTTSLTILTTAQSH